jgi:hypothetical protein
MPLLKLSISTSLLLHPDFAASPDQYALSHGVELVNPLIPETDFKKDSETKEKAAYDKFNIHLVHYKAIRLRVECKGDQLWVCSIKLNPSLLLYDDKHHPLVEGDLARSLDRLRKTVLPILADSLDSRHIVPGYCGSDEPIASWSKLESKMTLRGIDIHCLHDLHHPEAGLAHGTTKERLQLGPDEDDIIIRFEERIPTAPGAPEATLNLCLRRGALEAGFRGIGRIAKVKGIDRLVEFNATDIVRVLNRETSRISGTCLPIPPEWEGMGKPLTHAKAIALLAQHTDIPVDELLTMHEAIRKFDRKTRQRLDHDVDAAVACLKPVPVTSLFTLPV